MKKSISNRDLQRIARHANVTLDEARDALALRPELPASIHARVEAATTSLGYRITLRDRVAMASGASITTVNRAYRPGERHRVRKEILDVIEREAVRLGYTPDPLARAQRTEHLNTVAICPPHGHLFNPYFAAALTSLTAHLERTGHHAVITPIAAGRLLPGIAFSAVVGGIILWSGRDAGRRIDALRAAGRAVATFDPPPGAPGVRIDWASAAYHAVTHALHRGYRTLQVSRYHPDRWMLAHMLEGIARALNDHPGDARARVLLDPGVNAADAAHRLRDAGLERAAALLTSRDTQVQHVTLAPPVMARLPDTEWAVHDLEQLRPTPERRVAILGLSDFTARILIRHLRHRHPEWALDREYGIVGHDNIEPLVGHVNPVLTTLEYDIDAAVAAAVDSLAVQMNGAAAPAPASIPARVIYRESLS